jgi:hypothetical protein
MSNKEPQMLKAFTSKTDLLNAYSKAHSQPDNILASMKAVYRPHQFRGGWMIPGFGYSTERIGAYVQAEKAGVPA